MSFKFLNESVLGLQPEKTDHELLLECITESVRVDVYGDMLVESPDKSRLRRFIDAIKRFFVKIWNYIKSLFGANNDVEKAVEESFNEINKMTKEKSHSNQNKTMSDSVEDMFNEISNMMKAKNKFFRKRQADVINEHEVRMQEMEEEFEKSRRENEELMKKNDEMLDDIEKMVNEKHKIKAKDFESALYLYASEKCDLAYHGDGIALVKALSNFKLLMLDSNNNKKPLGDISIEDVKTMVGSIVRPMENELSKTKPLKEIVEKYVHDITTKCKISKKAAIKFLIDNPVLEPYYYQMGLASKMATSILESLSGDLDDKQTVALSIFANPMNEMVKLYNENMIYLNELKKQVAGPVDKVLTEEDKKVLLEEFKIG